MHVDADSNHGHCVILTLTGALLPTLLACSSPPVPTSVDLPVLPATVAGVVQTLPVVQVSAFGATRLALIDTGTSGAAISSSLMGVTSGSHLVDSICLGAFCSKDVWVDALDSPFTTPDGIQMIIGMEVLQQWPLEIDHCQRVRVGALADDCDVPDIPFVLDSTNRPFVTALVVDGVATPSALVDTGAVYTTLDATGSGALPSALRAEATAARLCTIDGCTDGGYSLVDSPTVCLGGSCAPQVAVKYPVYDAIGISFLVRFRVRFDFSAATLRLCDLASPAAGDAGPPDAGGDADAM